MPTYSSYLLKILDFGYFTVLSRTYDRFVSDLARVEYSQIDKIAFLGNYQHARLEDFRPNIFQNSFIATSLVPPIDTERVLNKLSISLQTPSLLSSRPSSRSS